MGRFRLKPVEFEAEQFIGEIPEILYNGNRELIPHTVELRHDPERRGYSSLEIDGFAHIALGDWIVRGASSNTFSVYGNDEFNGLFSPVEDDV